MNKVKEFLTLQAAEKYMEKNAKKLKPRESYFCDKCLFSGKYAVYLMNQKGNYQMEKLPRDPRDKSTLEERYKLYLELADDGEGFDITTGEQLKTFDQWLNS